VDAVLIGGLIVGTLGVFFLSNGLFGHVGNRILRWLLIMAPIIAYYAVSTGLGLTGRHTDTSLPYIGFLIGFLTNPLLLIAFTVFVVIMMSRRIYKSMQTPSPPALKITKAGRIFGIIAVCAGLVEAPLIGIFVYHMGFLETLPITIGVTVIFVVSIYVLQYLLGAAVFFAGNLTDHQLQLTGLILTLLGIATQLIPPILDLLNIPIR